MWGSPDGIRAIVCSFANRFHFQDDITLFALFLWRTMACHWARALWQLHRDGFYAWCPLSSPIISLKSCVGVVMPTVDGIAASLLTLPPPLAYSVIINSNSLDQWGLPISLDFHCVIYWQIRENVLIFCLVNPLKAFKNNDPSFRATFPWSENHMQRHKSFQADYTSTAVPYLNLAFILKTKVLCPMFAVSNAGCRLTEYLWTSKIIWQSRQKQECEKKWGYYKSRETYLH